MTTAAAIPAVAAQPTPAGRQIRIGPELPDGSVLVGYGDFDINTGPVNVMSITRAGDVLTHLEDMNNEEIVPMRLLSDGWVYIPALDPKSNVDAQVATNAPDGAWRFLTVHIDGENPIHLFDMTRHDGTLLVCGSKVGDPSRGTAMVWASDDNGTTWHEELEGAAGAYFDFLLVNGGDLAVRLDYTGDYRVRSTGWTAAPSAALDPRPTPRVDVTPGGRLVHSTHGDLGLLPAGTWSATLAADDSVWLCDGDTVYLLPAA